MGGHAVVLAVRILSPAATAANNAMLETTAATQYSFRTEKPNIARKAPAATQRGAVGQRCECGASLCSRVAIAAGGTEPLTWATTTLMLSGPPRKLARS